MGEARAFALTLAMGMPGGWNIDMSRSARESIPPAEYLAKSYYEIWIAGLEKLMAERGLVAPDEIDAGRALHPPKPVKRILNRADVAQVLYRGGPTEREARRAGALRGRRPRAREEHASRRPIRGCRATCAGMSA